MRVNRIRKARIRRKRVKKILLSFFVLMPSVSVIMGWLITDLFILPGYYK